MTARRPAVRSAVAALVSTIAMALAACSGGSGDLASQGPTDRLEVVSWWTSASEKPALESLFASYRAAHGGVNVVDGAIAGGGGSNVQVVLASRLRAGNPPDVWQTFIGSSTKAYAARGRIADVSSVYAAQNLPSVLPKAVLDAVTVDGKQYSMPTGSHRSNVLWFNRAALAKAGITPPRAGYTMPEFLADLDKVKQAGGTGMCLGGKDAFASAELFEDVLLATVGVDGWNRIVDDKFSWSGEQARSALSQFGTVLDHVDPANGGLTWDQATKKLTGGGCAFEAFNDSAYGELVADRATESTIGYVPFPGTEGSYIAVVDAFVVASGAADGRNALDFLRVVGSPEATLKFNAIKGSVPLRTDVDPSSLSPYQQSAAKALRESTFLFSIVHGEAMSPAFQEGFYDAVATYRTSRDPAAFAKTLTEAVQANQGLNAP
jgi:glucose/mannose transport system substrate-binding protein